MESDDKITQRMKKLAVGAVLIAVIWVGTAFIAPFFGEYADGCSRLTSEVNDVRQLVIASRTYSADHDGRFPDSLDQLYPDYIDDENVFRVRLTPDAPWQEYLYRPGLADTSYSEPVVLSPISHGRKVVVGKVDGGVAAYPKGEADKFRRLFEAGK